MNSRISSLGDVPSDLWPLASDFRPLPSAPVRQQLRRSRMQRLPLLLAARLEVVLQDDVGPFVPRDFLDEFQRLGLDRGIVGESSLIEGECGCERGRCSK